MLTSLDHIFNSIGINYKRIRVIVFTIPKTGTHTLVESIILPPDQHLIAFHSIIELGNLKKEFLLYSEKAVIEFILEHTELDRVFIISSYREPVSRIISFFYHNQRVGLVRTDQAVSILSSDFLFTYCADVMFVFQYIMDIWENDFGIDFTPNLYDKRDGYRIMVPKALPEPLQKKCVWVFTILDDFSLFFKNQQNPVFPFLKKQVERKNVNHNTVYLESKNKIKWDNIFLCSRLEEEEILIRFYNIHHVKDAFPFPEHIKNASEKLICDLQPKYNEFVSSIRNKYKEYQCK
jgi:hypothetical protein